MKVIFYSTDAELRQILQTRVDPAAPAAVILPRGMAWLVAGDFHGSCLDVFALRADSAQWAVTLKN